MDELSAITSDCFGFVVIALWICDWVHLFFL